MPPGLPIYSSRMIADVKQMVETLNRETSKVLVRKARGGGGSGDSVVVAATKADLIAPGATEYFKRGWVTGELGTNYGPWIWNGTGWVLLPVTYTTLSDSAREGDFAIVSNKGYMKVTSGSGDDKWVRTTHLDTA